MCPLFRLPIRQPRPASGGAASSAAAGVVPHDGAWVVVLVIPDLPAEPAQPHQDLRRRTTAAATCQQQLLHELQVRRYI